MQKKIYNRLLNLKYKINTSLYNCFRRIVSKPCRFWLDKRRPSTTLVDNELIIVSMTSWLKRIKNVSSVIDSILQNSVLPDKIVLNLSIEEFPNKEDDLPEALCNYQKSGILEIFWESGNTKAFKKIIPTLKRYPKDVIISIDDDILYPRDFIESFIMAHKKDMINPITGTSIPLLGASPHNGWACLVKAEHFGNFIDELIDEKVIQLGMDDVFYTFCTILNGYHYKYVGKDFGQIHYNPIDRLSVNPAIQNGEQCKYLIEKVWNMYKIDCTSLQYPCLFRLPL